MSAAADAAAAEALRWAALAAEWTEQRHPEAWAVRRPTEAAVVVFGDPRGDLERRAARWGYPLGAGDLADLCRFAAALAQAEAEAWAADEPHVATRAYEDRRFLAGDRILHWAVPWLDAVGAPGARDELLALGDELRPAPLTGEGLTAPGEDAYGPERPPVAADELLDSLWSGALLDEREPARYKAAADRWIGLAARHPGTAALWRALADRAARTERSLAQDSVSRADPG